MPTPVSGSSAYCTPAQFLQSYDARTIGQLVADDDVQVEPEDLLDNAVLAKILKQASGKVEAAALMGERYTAADLAALTGNSKEFLAGLVADIAIGLIHRRRPDLDLHAPEQCDEADELLNAIAEGRMVFGLKEQTQTGHMTAVKEEPVNVEERNLATYQARRLFGVRGNRRSN